MDTTVLVAVVGGAAALGGAGIAGAVAVWVAHRQGKPQDTTAAAAALAAEAAVQQTINDGFAKLSAQYDARNTELAKLLNETNGKLEETLAANEQLAGEVRDLTQHVESLESALRRLGYDIPRRRRPHPMAQPPLVALPAAPEAPGD